MAQMTSLSGAAAFTPSAVPRPQPSAPPCPSEKYVPGLVKFRCSARRQGFLDHDAVVALHRD